MSADEKSPIIEDDEAEEGKCGCCCCLGSLNKSNKHTKSSQHSSTSIQPITSQHSCCAAEQQQTTNLLLQQNILQPQIAKFLLSSTQLVTDDPVTEESEKIGRIQFSVKYEAHIKTLTLKIIRAINLEAKDIGGTSDPYVKVTLLPNKKVTLTTRTKHKNCNPTWNETFSFEDYPFDKIQQMILFMEVIDYDRFTRDDPIGEVEIPLMNFDLLGGQTVWKNLRPSQKRTGRLGDLCLTLRYDSPLMNVKVVQACNLKAKDINGKSDPYVKIWLMMDGVKRDKKKTTIKEKNLNPEFNESFTFNVPADKIRSASLLVSVMDYDRFGRNEPIGQIILGAKTSPEEVKHWNEMLQKPRKDIFQWHTLKAFK